MGVKAKQRSVPCELEALFMQLKLVQESKDTSTCLAFMQN